MYLTYGNNVISVLVTPIPSPFHIYYNKKNGPLIFFNVWDNMQAAGPWELLLTSGLNHAVNGPVSSVCFR